jgi:hypothetical protein
LQVRRNWQSDRKIAFFTCLNHCRQEQIVSNGRGLGLSRDAIMPPWLLCVLEKFDVNVSWDSQNVAIVDIFHSNFWKFRQNSEKYQNLSGQEKIFGKIAEFFQGGFS